MASPAMHQSETTNDGSDPGVPRQRKNAAGTGSGEEPLANDARATSGPASSYNGQPPSSSDDNATVINNRSASPRRDGSGGEKLDSGEQSKGDTPFPGSGDTTNADGIDFQSQYGTPWSQRSFLYQFMPFRGMFYDVRGRLPFYPSDWTNGFRPKTFYRIVAASIRMYFINLLPAIAYLLDMNHRTDGAYGINEVILASALAAIVFPIFSVQPLTIVGVTGLINLFNYTNYDIILRYPGVDYLQFQAWVCIWAAIFHFLFAIFNISDYSRFITDLTSETFGFYVGIVYIQKGIELLVFEFQESEAGGWLSVTVAILFAVVVYFVQRAGNLPFGPFWLRKLLNDFAFPLAAVFFSGFVHIPGHIADANLQFLPITRSWFPSTDRSWAISFWDLQTKWIFIAIPFGFLLTLLFYFDHNVSALMAQARQYPVKRPAGFHWDFFLLGIVTLVAGILGLPAPNGLVPQAPVNSESLSIIQRIDKDFDAKEGIIVSEEDYDEWKKRVGDQRNRVQHKIVRTGLLEQRVSHLAIGLLTLGTMTRPLLVVLGLMPRALFAGVFLIVGWGSIEGNGITHKTLFLLRDPKMTSKEHILLHVPKRKILLFVGIQWVVFAMTFAISNTIAAIGFPVIIILLIPFRYYFGPRWFSPGELAVLDAPTANSPAVMVSIGSDLERVTGEGLEVAPDTGIAGTRYRMRRNSFGRARTRSTSRAGPMSPTGERFGSHPKRMNSSPLAENPEIAESGQATTEEEAREDRLAAWRVRSRREDDEAHVQNVTSIRR